MWVEMITFDIVDMPYAYNFILGQGTLNKFGADSHHNYLCMKIPGAQELISIHGDESLARRIEYGHRAPLDSRHVHNVAKGPLKDPSPTCPEHWVPSRPQLEGDVKHVPLSHYHD